MDLQIIWTFFESHKHILFIKTILKPGILAPSARPACRKHPGIKVLSSVGAACLQDFDTKRGLERRQRDLFVESDGTILF
jgi:hypothetical protein